jgi:hypothetical protein
MVSRDRPVSSVAVLQTSFISHTETDISVNCSVDIELQFTLRARPIDFVGSLEAFRENDVDS